jgi:hypothetical protein
VRYAKRRDANDGLIAESLVKSGFTVHDFASAGQGIPDKLITRLLPDGTPWVCWVEIKMPKGKLREAQEAFRDTFEPRGEYYVARDAQDAVKDLYERYTEAIKPEHSR